MNQAREKLSHTWRHIQSFLFPMIWDELGELTAKQKLLISVLEAIKLEEYLPYIGRVPGRPSKTALPLHGPLRMGAQRRCTERVYLLTCLCRVCREPLARTGASDAY